MPSLSSSLEPKEKLEIILNAIDDKKGVDPDVIDLSGQSLVADYFVITHGTSNIHIRSVSDGVIEAMEEHAHQRARREGDQDASWVLLDYGDVVVHVFSEAARSTYKIDRLWRSTEELRAAKMPKDSEPVPLKLEDDIDQP